MLSNLGTSPKFIQIKTALHKAVNLINEKLHKIKKGTTTSGSNGGESAEKIRSKKNNETIASTAAFRNTDAAAAAAAAALNVDEQSERQQNAQYRTTAQSLIYYIIHEFLRQIKPEKYDTTTTPLVDPITTSGTAATKLQRKAILAATTNNVAAAAAIKKKAAKNKAAIWQWSRDALLVRDKYMWALIHYFYKEFANLVGQRYNENCEKQPMDQDSMILNRLYRSVLLELDLLSLFQYFAAAIRQDAVKYPLREFLRFSIPQIVKHSQYPQKAQHIDVPIDALRAGNFTLAIQAMCNICRTIKYRNEPMPIKTTQFKILPMSKYNELAQNTENMYKYVQEEHDVADLVTECLQADFSTDTNQKPTFYLLMFKSKNLIFDCIDHPLINPQTFRMMSWLDRLESIRNYFRVPIIMLEPITEIDIVTTHYKQDKKIVYVTLVGLDRSRLVFRDKKTRPVAHRFSKVTPSDLQTISTKLIPF